MKRDYSEQEKQYLLKMISEVEATDTNKFWDNVGDFWLGVEQTFGFLKIDRYLDNVSKYHKKVIDKNDISKSQIEQMFQNIYQINYRYKVRLASMQAELDSYLSVIKTLQDIVEPSKANHNPLFIETRQKGIVDKYIKQHDVLTKLATDGLTSDDIVEVGPSALEEILPKVADYVIDHLPSLKMGDKIEIPIGPNMSVYYKVSGKAEGKGKTDIELEIENQKLKLKDIESTFGPNSINASVDSDGKITVNGQSGNSSISMDGQNLIIKQKTETIGNNTYSVSIMFDSINNAYTIEYSVKTEVEEAEITSSLGIKYSDNKWQPIPETVPIDDPVPCYRFDWQPDWGSISEKDVQIMVTAGVVIVIIAGVVVATGGAGAGALALVAI